MTDYKIDIQLRWSDFDPTLHIRHSVYYDWGDICRIGFLEKAGLTAHGMQAQQMSPILLREECIFKREIVSGDRVSVDLKLIKARRDFSRWSIIHTIRKNEEIISALLTVDAAWINTRLRKMSPPPPEIERIFAETPQSEDFHWTD